MQHQHINKPEQRHKPDSDHISAKHAHAEKLDVQSAGVPLYLQRLQTQLLQRQPVEEVAVQMKPASIALQAKLTVSQPNDPYEKEADHISDQVMSIPDTSMQPQPIEEEYEGLQPKSNEQTLQRQAEHEKEEEEEEDEEEKPIQTKFIGGAITSFQKHSVQRQPIEEELIQPEGNTGMASQVTPRVAHDINSMKGKGQPLSASERAFFEPRFGKDFSSVRVHTDNRAAHTAHSINASAFTLGRDVVFGAGQYSPSSSSGRSLLAHELTHVVQQNIGIDSGLKRKSVPFMGECLSAHGLRHVGDRKTNNFQRSLGTKLSEKISRQGIINRVQRHLSVNTAVSEFKSEVNNPTLLKSGQFYWSSQLKPVIKNKYQTILNASWSGVPKTTLQNYLDGLLALSYEPRGEGVRIAKLRRKILRFLSSSGNSTAPDIKKIVGTGYYRTRKKGTYIFQTIWIKYKSTLTLPSLTQYARFDKLQGLSMFEYIACWSAAERVSKFFVAKGGYSIGTRSTAKKIGGIALCRRVRRDNTDVGGYKKGDVVTYYSNLGSVITKIKSSLDDGYHIHARVLSGIYSGAKPTCRQEHSINIIGYDGNKFVFWDPDSTKSANFGGGFGFLYYDALHRRFTTAKNDAALRVDSSGDHMGGSQHRYQVLTVRSI